MVTGGSRGTRHLRFDLPDAIVLDVSQDGLPQLEVAPDAHVNRTSDTSWQVELATGETRRIRFNRRTLDPEPDVWVDNELRSRPPYSLTDRLLMGGIWVLVAVCSLDPSALLWAVLLSVGAAHWRRTASSERRFWLVLGVAHVVMLAATLALLVR